MPPQLVLDVSNTNTIGTTLLKRSGAVALIAKATEGTTFIDRAYPSHREVAKAVGIPFGGYLFLHPDSHGSEADYFLRYADPRLGDLEPIVDAETGLPEPSAHRALSCLRRLEAEGYRPILYASASYLVSMLLERPELRKFRVWEAAYSGKRQPIRHGVSVVMWQYTSTYRVLWRRFDASRLYVPVRQLLIT